MLLRLCRFILVNLVGLCILPGSLICALAVTWVMCAIILIKMQAIFAIKRTDTRDSISWPAKIIPLWHLQFLCNSLTRFTADFCDIFNRFNQSVQYVTLSTVSYFFRVTKFEALIFTLLLEPILLVNCEKHSILSQHIKFLLTNIILNFWHNRLDFFLLQLAFSLKLYFLGSSLRHY